MNIQEKVRESFTDKELAIFILYYNNVYKGDIADWFGMKIQDVSELIDKFDTMLRNANIKEDRLKFLSRYF